MSDWLAASGTRYLGTKQARQYVANPTNDVLWKAYASVEEQFGKIDSGLLQDVLEVQLLMIPFPYSFSVLFRQLSIPWTSECEPLSNFWFEWDLKVFPGGKAALIRCSTALVSTSQRHLKTKLARGWHTGTQAIATWWRRYILVELILVDQQ